MARILTVVSEREKIKMPQLGIYRWENVWLIGGRAPKDWFKKKHPEEWKKIKEARVAHAKAKSEKKQQQVNKDASTAVVVEKLA